MSTPHTQSGTMSGIRPSSISSNDVLFDADDFHDVSLKSAGPFKSSSVIPPSSSSSAAPTAPSARVAARPGYRWTPTESHDQPRSSLSLASSSRPARGEEYEIGGAQPPAYGEASYGAGVRASEHRTLSAAISPSGIHASSSSASSSTSPPPFPNGHRPSPSTSSASSLASADSSWALNEKAAERSAAEASGARRSLSDAQHHRRSGSIPRRSLGERPRPSSSSHTAPERNSSGLIEHQRHYGQRVKSRSCIHPKVKPWLPMMSWFATTIGLAIAVAFWRTQVFTGLDDLSIYMKKERYFGQAMLFGLIFLTTFPPLPMYSTLMMLAGYTYGATTAFFISYAASLLGALVVFLIFRHLVPSSIAASLLPPSLKRVIRAIEARPNIFLLIRVAPYPYNVLNAVLGSSSTMTLGRYIGTTAISLLKVIVHTTLGSEIRSFKDLHSAKKQHAEAGGAEEDKPAMPWGEVWTIIGVILCVGLFIYLSFVARKAVNEECPDEVSETSGEGDGDVSMEIGSGTGMTQRPGPNGYAALPTSVAEPAHDLRSPAAVASENPFDRPIGATDPETEAEEDVNDTPTQTLLPHRRSESAV